MSAYNVVITPMSFHKSGKHTLDHVCSQMIIGDKSEGIAIEIADGVERALMNRYPAVEREDIEPDECEITHTVYRINDPRGTLLLHVRIMKAGSGCQLPSGNKCNVLEYERDIECIIDSIDECFEYYP